MAESLTKLKSTLDCVNKQFERFSTLKKNNQLTHSIEPKVSMPQLKLVDHSHLNTQLSEIFMEKRCLTKNYNRLQGLMSVSSTK